MTVLVCSIGDGAPASSVDQEDTALGSGARAEPRWAAHNTQARRPDRARSSVRCAGRRGRFFPARLFSARFSSARFSFFLGVPLPREEEEDSSPLYTFGYVMQLREADDVAIVVRSERVVDPRE